MIGIRLSSITATLALLAAVSVTGAAQAADSAEQFFKGKTVTILLGQPPGGSYDLYARLAADHMSRFIPGHPSIQVQYKPGGGGAVAVSYFYEQAPKDGTMLGLFSETIAQTQLTDPGIGKWKMQDMTYIGSFAGVNAAFVRRKDAPAKTVEEMRTTAMNVGCSGRTSQSYSNPAMLKNLAGFKFNIACGYPGSAEYVLALERGEVDMVSSAWNQWTSVHSQKLADGIFVPVIQSGLKRHRDLQNVPLMQDLVDDPQLKKVMEFASAGAAVGRALLLPPKVPQDRIDALSKAFDEVVKDPKFLEDAKTRGAEIDPSSGTEVQKASLAIVATPKDIVDLAAKGME